MKKRNVVLTVILAITMVFAIIFTAMPMSIMAADVTDTALAGTKLTTSHAGQTLSAGDYYVEPGTTLTLRGGSGKSGLALAQDSTVTIFIPENSVLNVYGGAASGTKGAGAGIEVVEGSVLRVTGSGTLNAYGGNGANGSNGAKGDNASYVDDGNSYIPDSGYGGAGGGGAGAGIGTKGGNGGSSTSWRLGFYGGRNQNTNSFMYRNYSGTHGYNGNSGASATDCGSIFISGNIIVNAKGGSAGAYGGSGGSMGTRDYESDDSDIRGIAGGSGGGGGGSGKAGADIGTGGGGGGSGGSGGGVGYAWSCWFLGAGGGGGGAGAVGGGGGAWSSDSQIPNHDCGKYQNGKETSSFSGNVGTTTSGGAGGSGCKVQIRYRKSTSASWEWPYGGTGGRGGSAGANYTETAVQELFAVSVDNGESTVEYYASANEFLPAALPVQEKTGYTFKGYIGADGNTYYDQSGVRTAQSVTAQTVSIFATFEVNDYDYTINRDPQSDDYTDTPSSGNSNYGDAIELTTPSRSGYIFRGWKITASTGTLNSDAYYSYTPVAAMARTYTLRSSTQTTSSFIRDGASYKTAGVETIGSSVTLYNLSAEDGAVLTIEEVWEKDEFTVTFENFDKTVIDTQTGQSTTLLTSPAIPENISDYYTYTFKYWKCNIDGQYYTSEALPNMGAFLGYESEYGDAVYSGITFTAVYDIEYKKELHFVGSLGNDDLVMSDPSFPNGVLILGEGDTGIPVVTNFKLTKNDGVAALLLIPQYDKSVFSIKAISVNGELVYGTGATSNTVLDGFNLEITGNETESDALKILLDNLTPDASVSDDIFVQIVYEMDSAIGGKYEFGFVTATAPDTDSVTHGDRSEAYGTYDPDANTDTDAWQFNELGITVDTTAINVVVRVNGQITIEENQSFIYNGEQMSAADITEMIENVLQYNYNGFAKRESDTITINWYDEAGNLLSAPPKDAGKYKIGISAAQTTYYNATDGETVATFEITPYKIFVTAQDQTFEYNGSNIIIDSSASKGGIYIKDADGNLISVDEFVSSELQFSGVVLDGDYINAGEYLDAINGVIIAVGEGKLDNYKVNYEHGALIITKAVNEWIGAVEATGGEYSGQRFDEVIFDAKFGSDTAKVKYLYGYTEDEDGERVEDWRGDAPINAGSYIVCITIDGTDNYTVLETEVELIITKKQIHVGGLTFTAIDKIYNGDSQYWSINPDGNDETNDAEVTLTVDDISLLQHIIFVGMNHPQECKNVGSYQIEALLQVANSNYTFVTTDTYTDEDGNNITEEREVDTCALPVDVKILKRQIIVNANDQTSVYDGNEPDVNQGITEIGSITLEDGTIPDFIIREFFGQTVEVYVAATDYDATAVYYSYKDKAYEVVSLTEEQFNENKALYGGEEYVEYYVLTTETVYSTEVVTLSKVLGSDAGTYALLAALGADSNYEILDVTGSYIITKLAIVPPTFDDVIYNQNSQKPTLGAEFEDIYQFIFADGEDYINAGSYEIIVSLVSPNHQWILDVNDESSTTLDDQTAIFTIAPKEITVILPSAQESYEYGVTDIVWNGSYTWQEAPFDGDDVQITFGFDEDYHLTVGTHWAKVLSVFGEDSANYNVVYGGGDVVIIKKALTSAEIIERIKTAIKYYTGEAITWDSGDFIVNIINGYLDTVLAVTPDALTSYIDANGIYENGEFIYHSSENKYYIDLTVQLLDTDNYELAADVVNNIVEVEVFIAKSANVWESEPTVDASDITDIKYEAASSFGTATIKYYTDAECQNEISPDALLAGTQYYAKFTVEDTDNYYGLTFERAFSSTFIFVARPALNLDSLDGEAVLAGESLVIIYDGVVHSFIAPSSEYYTVIITAAEWKNVGTYIATVSLNNTGNQYVWDDTSTADLVYTLEIAQRELSITAEDKTVSFGAEAPEYTAAANGLADGETLDALLSSDIGSYISCGYTKGSDAGEYIISILEAIKDELKNYNVSLVSGTLTVQKQNFDYIVTPPGEIIQPTVGTIIISGASEFVYDSTGKGITVEVPTELEYTIKYLDENGNELLGVPKNAGIYTAIVTTTLKDGYSSINYIVPSPKEVELTIARAEITITVYDQTSYEYDGTDIYNKFIADVISNGIENYYIVSFDNVSEFNDGSAVSEIVLTQAEYINASEYLNVISATHSYDEANYDVTLITGDLVIAKATNEWTVPLYSASGIIYDKNMVEEGEDLDFFAQAKFGEEAYTFYQLVGGQYIALSVYPTDAGTYYIQANIEGNDNYTGLTTDFVELVIGKRSITVADVIFNDYTVYYDGNAHSVFATDIDGLFNISYVGNGQINAGAYTVTATFTPKDTVNYELSGENSKSVALNIQKVKVTITAEDKNSVYGNALAELEYSISFVGNDEYLSLYQGGWGEIVLATDATPWSDVGVYDIVAQTISGNANYEVSFIGGEYTIERFENNEITLTLDSQSINYLMELIYSSSALRGEGTVVYTFAISEDGPYTSEVPKNQGTYYIKAEIAETSNYGGATAVASFEIKKATLSAITGIIYNKDTATWTVVTTTTDGKTVDCGVSYLVGESILTDASFKATTVGTFGVIAVPEDTLNYNSSAEVLLAPVYSIDFADKRENHQKQPELAILTNAAYETQYRFEGQNVTMPSAYDSSAIPTVKGYKFSAWQLDGQDYGFNVGVTESITLYANWTINTYKITFYNEVVDGSKVENGIFYEGTVSYVEFGSKTFEYGDVIVFIDGVPTKADDVIYTYTFNYWADINGNEIDSAYIVTDNDSFYAVYSSTAQEFTVTYMLSIDGGSYFVEQTVTAPYGTPLITLKNESWFIADTWYKDSARGTQAPSFVPAENATLYGAYLFDIGAADVNADGIIDVSDITLYRRFIVGGYNIVHVAPGSEWDLVTSDDFNKDTVYFVERVSDANRDESGDIRDITTIRMALTGGYGYDYTSGRDSAAGVTGFAVVLKLDEVPGISSADALMAAIEGAGTEEVYIKLIQNIVLDEVVVIDSSKKITINLNGYNITMANITTNYTAVIKSGTLTIEGDGTVIVPGPYGFGTAVGAESGNVVINGGTFIAENTNYLFACFDGSITINGGSFVSNYCVLNCFDGYNGVATVNGGEFSVVGDYEIYPSIFLGNVTVNAGATYHVRTDYDLYMALESGGYAILEDDIDLSGSLLVPAGKTAVLDLNGYDLSYTADESAASQLIKNEGELTILGEGTLNYQATNPDTQEVPSYATNTITNKGSLTVGAGVTVLNSTSGGASYAVDNDGFFHLDGGTIKSNGTALRICSFTLSDVEAVIDGGLIEGKEGIRIQLTGDDSSVAPVVDLTVNGGVIRSVDEDGFAMTTYSFGNSYSGTTIVINGGEFYGWTTVGAGNSDLASITVTAGSFDHGGIYDYTRDEYITPPEAE